MACHFDMMTRQEMVMLAAKAEKGTIVVSRCMRTQSTIDMTGRETDREIDIQSQSQSHSQSRGNRLTDSVLFSLDTAVCCISSVLCLCVCRASWVCLP